MKIAFVAKGGSGKSTVTSLFVRFLEEKKKQYLCVDADINMHIKDIVGVDIKKDKYLSNENNVESIKTYLRGNNTRIAKASQIVKTTPPSGNSNFLFIKKDNFLIQNFAASVQDCGFAMSVGTYEEEGIGESCYHSDLSIFEAILSHTITDMDHLLVADMTAGTDSFAGTLHAQFDLVCLVVDPSRESVNMARDYLNLAQKAGVIEFVSIIGNKIEDETDVEYIEKELGQKVLTFIPLIKDLKFLRRENKNIFALNNDLFDAIDLESIYIKSQENFQYADSRLKLLFNLHEKHVAADYIINRHGDLRNQIDKNFSYKNFKYDDR